MNGSLTSIYFLRICRTRRGMSFYFSRVSLSRGAPPGEVLVHVVLAGLVELHQLKGVDGAVEEAVGLLLVSKREREICKEIKKF